jgi:pentatricopeptide repeat protein
MKNKGGRTRPDSKTFSAAISCCGKAGQWEEATRIFNQMAAEGFYFHFHIIVIPVHSAFY